MHVSVIITHYKTPDVLKLSLGYILEWKKHYEKNNTLTAEIIVSDSETIPETQQIIEDELKNEIVYLTSKENLGYGKAANRGIEAAKGEYIFIMNADLVVEQPSELNKLIEYLENNKDVGIVGPKLLNADDSIQQSAFRFYTPMTIVLRRTPLGKLPWGKRKLERFQLKDKKDLTKKPTEVDWLMGSALLTKKEYLEKIGGFDEDFFMYMEDVDLCRRFWEAGLKVVYNPESTMRHYHGKASRHKNLIFAVFNKYTRTHIKSGFTYFKKHGVKTPHFH